MLGTRTPNGYCARCILAGLNCGKTGLNKPQMSWHEALRELELDVGATLDQVKQQYRRLAMMWHPDKNKQPAAGSRMVRLNLAYETLCLPHQNESFSPGTGHNSPVDEDDDFEHKNPFHNHSDPFGYASGFRDNPQFAKRGKNITRKVKLTMFEAAFGCKKTVQGETTDYCASCGGSGRANGDGNRCHPCAGMGRIYPKGRGRYAYTTWCQECGGSGQVLRRCGACHGSGNGHTREWRIDVTFKPGVTDGLVLRSPGHGGKSSSEHLSGDLILTIQIIEHPHFRFTEEGLLEVEVPISTWLWMAGGEVVIPLLDGARVVNFPSRASEICVEGQGWPKGSGSSERSDLIVKLTPRPVNNVSPEQRMLLEQLAKEQRDVALDAWNEEMLAWTHGTADTRFGSVKPKRTSKRRAQQSQSRA